MFAKESRRDFLRKTALGGLGLLVLKDSRSVWSYQANEKLNMAFVGAGGQGGGLAGAFAGLGENIVALCDVDEQRAAGAFQKFPDARRHHDFRKMLEEMRDQIDAVVVATPDHTHAAAAVMAMKLGKHVYCEKPLTHSIYEARVMRDVAQQYKVATQMGNHGTASGGLRQGVEVIQSGAMGQVREAHVWSNRPVWPQGMERPQDAPPVPPHLQWDLWLGPAPARPYHPAYLPFAWRGWCDFGTGALGDMGCHTMNLPVMALKLHQAITAGQTIVVEALSSGCNGESYPKWSLLRYDFPARGDLAPVQLFWYDGGLKPPQDLLKGQPMPGSGCLLIGDKGTLFSPGDVGGEWRLLPADQFKDYQPPAPTLPRSPGHQREWVVACKGGSAAMSNFVDYAASLAEIIVLGNLAIRLRQRIEWDAGAMKAQGCPEADPLIRREYRQGWSL